MVDFINYKTPKVKWGVPEAIGNIAQKYPSKVEKAIPFLLENTKENSTVVRWCAAFALTEIAKSNLKVREELRSRIEEIAKNEKNNGVKNVYLKALRIINK